MLIFTLHQEEHLSLPMRSNPNPTKNWLSLETKGWKGLPAAPSQTSLSDIELSDAIALPLAHALQIDKGELRVRLVWLGNDFPMVGRSGHLLEQRAKTKRAQSPS